MLGLGCCSAPPGALPLLVLLPLVHFMNIALSLEMPVISEEPKFATRAPPDFLHLLPPQKPTPALHSQSGLVLEYIGCTTPYHFLAPLVYYGALLPSLTSMVCNNPPADAHGCPQRWGFAGNASNHGGDVLL